jgi:hypothetical protein
MDFLCPGTDIRISKIFLPKNCRCSKKTMLWSKFCKFCFVLSQNFSANFFGKNILKIIISVPGHFCQKSQKNCDHDSDWNSSVQNFVQRRFEDFSKMTIEERRPTPGYREHDQLIFLQVGGNLKTKKPRNKEQLCTHFSLMWLVFDNRGVKIR